MAPLVKVLATKPDDLNMISERILWKMRPESYKLSSGFHRHTGAYVYTCTYTYTHMHMHIHTHIYTYIQMHMHI